MLRTTVVMVACFILIAFGVATASEEEELARQSQNPIANLISLPFQNNINFDVGPKEKTQNVLNIQPVWPFQLGEDWNLITRTIAPVISQPAMAPGDDREFGLGDITFTSWFSPRKPGKWIWGGRACCAFADGNR
jgi:hypothetical protein